MTKSLDGKAILITGAGSGLGRAAAIVCAREGALLMLSDINQAGLEETQALLSAAGGGLGAENSRRLQERGS